MRILAFLLLIFGFCPNFLVSCSFQTIPVSALDAVVGVKAHGENVTDPNPLLLICFLIPIIILFALYSTQKEEIAVGSSALTWAVIDIIVWIVFAIAVKKFADDNMCDFEFAKLFYCNIAAMVLLALIGRQIVLERWKLDDDLIETLAGKGKNPANAKQEVQNPALSYCPKCGGKLPFGAKFCSQCGANLSNDLKVEAEKAQPVETVTVPLTAEEAERKARKEAIRKQISLHKKMLGIICAAAAVLIVGGIVLFKVVTAPKTINLDQYLTVSAEGYSGKGRPAATIDWSAIEEEYGTSLSFTDEAEDRYGEAINDMSPFEELKQSVGVSFMQESELSNGDRVVYEWVVDADFTENVNCKLEYTGGELSVSGLPEITYFDPFDGICVNFSGVSPYGECTLSMLPNNGLVYEVSSSSYLSEGEMLFVSVSYGNESEENYLAEYGRLPSSMSKDFRVEGLDKYMSCYDDLDENAREQLKYTAEDSITNFYAENEEEAAADIEYVGYAFLRSRVGESAEDQNTLFYIYRGTMDDRCVYFQYKWTNLILGEAGLNAFCQWGLSEYLSPYTMYADIAENQEDCIFECGDGFEKFGEDSEITSAGDIDSEYFRELEKETIRTIEDYIKREYDKRSCVEGLEVKGYYFVAAQSPVSVADMKNAIAMVASGHLYHKKDAFKECDVLYPVVFSNIERSGDSWSFGGKEGPQGQTDIPDSTYYTKGYLDGKKMYHDLKDSVPDNFILEISEGLKEFGE